MEEKKKKGMNFIAPCLSPQVSSNKPSADGYEVDNLVSGRKGFMGTYFIRPPLDITVVFPVPIDISYIKLVARLEQKCSTGFLIFTEPEDISCQHQQAHPRKASKPGIPSTSHSGHSSPSCAPSHDPPKPLTTSPDGDSDIYFCVGQFYTKAEDELVLTNHHYRHWLRLPMPNANGNIKDPRVFRGSLRHSNRKALKCVKSVIIRIQSTAERGPPVLRSLEVWGQPGISTKKLRRRELLREWSFFKPLAQSEPVVPRLYNSYPEEKKIQKPGLEALRNNDLLEVPEDFLDPLTCDVMTVPLLLPSGNSIDAHTLERFIASEGTWGRPASDPFTGVPFRGDKQPVPNVPLKARIDRFLLANGEHPEVEKCGRTVGSSLSTSEATPGTSTSVSNKRVSDYLEAGDLSDCDNKRKAIRDETGNLTSVKSRDSEEDTGSDSFDDLSKEIEAALKGKPKYLPTPKCNEKQKEDEELQCLTGKISSSNVLHVSKAQSHLQRVQTLKNNRDLITRPSQCLPAPGSSSKSHHGIVQMIGGILSATQGRTARTKRLPAHHVNDKPNHLICGDKPSQNYEFPFTNSASCSCGETEALYKLDCEHLLCRNCLLEKHNHKVVVCNTCQRTSIKTNISKYHNKSIFSS